MGAFANSPGKMRPGSFKVATETWAGSRHGRPRAGAAPAGWQRCCGAMPGMEQAWARPVWGCRCRILTLSRPLLPWEHPEHVGKGMTVVRGQRRAGNCGTGSAALGRREPRSHHSQPLHPSSGTRQENCHPSATPVLPLP